MLDHGPHIKAYDSPTVREWEAWKSLQSDLRGVTERVAIFVVKFDVEGWTISEASSLWDSALVKLFRHYGDSVISDIREAYERTVERTGLEWEFAQWRKQRDKRVAHPVGHEEFYQVRVYLDEMGSLEEIKYGGGSLIPVAKDAAELGRFAENMETVEVNPRVALLQKEIEKEIRSLPRSGLKSLRQFHVHAHGRRFGA